MFLRDKLFRSNGMCIYSVSLITEGMGMENRGAWIQFAELSSANATPFRMRTTARRAGQTLIGSNDALRTNTREFILSLKYNVARRGVSKVTVALRGSANCQFALSPSS